MATKKKEKNKLKKETKNIFFNAGFAVLTLLFPILFYNQIILTTILCLAISLIGLIKWNSRVTSAVFLFGLLFGAISEMIATSFGVWEYTHASFIGIPLWLFIVWGNASAFIYQTAIELERLGLHD